MVIDLAGYVVLGIGNHEFDFGPYVFADLVSGNEVPRAELNDVLDDGTVIVPDGMVMPGPGINVATILAGQATATAYPAGGEGRITCTSSRPAAAACPVATP